jgi:hypothetical protein
MRETQIGRKREREKETKRVREIERRENERKLRPSLR